MAIPGKLKAVVERRPVLAYVFLCYAISWSIWFSVPLFSGGNWTLIKILVGVGMGPGLAAIILDRVRGTGGLIGTGRWWSCFAVVFFAVTALNASSLITGDGPTATEFAAATAPGITVVGIVASLLTAAVAGFIFASAATSHSQTLRSITAWRVPARWWLISLFLLAAFSVLGLAIELAAGGEMPPSIRGGLPPLAWYGFVVRAALFTMLVVAVGEEPGWRGWMLPEVQKRYSPLVSSIIVGVTWGFWHLPLFVNGAYPGSPVDIIEYLFTGPMFALLLTWLYNRTAGNLLLALVLHTAANNTGRLLPSTGTYSALFLLFIAIVLFVDRMWRRPRVTETTASPVLAV